MTDLTRILELDADQIHELLMRPGKGWQHLSGPVWEHSSGTRVHEIGVIRLPDNTHLSINNLREGEIGRLLVRINGGNRKRGLMAWAANIARKYP